MNYSHARNSFTDYLIQDKNRMLTYSLTDVNIQFISRPWWATVFDYIGYLMLHCEEFKELALQDCIYKIAFSITTVS